MKTKNHFVLRATICAGAFLLMVFSAGAAYAGRVVVEVTDCNGNGVAGATVELWSVDPGPPRAETRVAEKKTPPNGTVEFAPVNNGTYLVRVGCPNGDYLPTDDENHDFTVKGNRTVYQRFKCCPGSGSGKRLTLTTTIQGTINGVSFTAKGKGTGDTATGRVEGLITFNRPLKAYTPLLSRTWKCIHHKPFARPTAGADNPFARSDGNWDSVAVVTYETGETIQITAQVRRVSPTHQHVTQTRIGAYSGPVDIAEQLSYDDLLEPMGPGKVRVTGRRLVRRTTGGLLAIRWEETVTFPDGTTLLTPMSMHYEVIKTKWDPATRTFAVTTDMSISPIIRELPPGKAPAGSEILATPVGFAGGTLTGVVHGPDGQPAKNVDLTITGTVESKAKTDEEGHFTIPVLGPVGSEIKVAAAGIAKTAVVRIVETVGQAASSTPPAFVQPGEYVHLTGSYKRVHFQQNEKVVETPVATATGPKPQQAVTTFETPQDAQPGEATWKTEGPNGASKEYKSDVFLIVKKEIDDQSLRSGQNAKFVYEFDFGQTMAGREVEIGFTITGAVVPLDAAPRRVRIGADGHASAGGQVKARPVAPGTSEPFTITPAIKAMKR